ncbi:hypothetical protein ACM66B_002774 [Microbotryomycetes sp. NB124-2]
MSEGQSLDDFGGTKSKSRSQGRNTKRYGGVSKRRIKWGRGGSQSGAGGAERGASDGGRGGESECESDDERIKRDTSPNTAHINTTAGSTLEQVTFNAHKTSEIRMRFSSASPAKTTRSRASSRNEPASTLAQGKKRTASTHLSSDPAFQEQVLQAKRLRHSSDPRVAEASRTTHFSVVVQGRNKRVPRSSARKVTKTAQMDVESALENFVLGEKSNVPSQSSPKKSTVKAGGVVSSKQSSGSTLTVYRDAPRGDGRLSSVEVERAGRRPETWSKARVDVPKLTPEPDTSSTVSLPRLAIDDDGPSMIQPSGSPDESSIVVFERDESGDLTATAWRKLIPPPPYKRVVDQVHQADVDEAPTRLVRQVGHQRHSSNSSLGIEALNLTTLQDDLPLIDQQLVAQATSRPSPPQRSSSTSASHVNAQREPASDEDDLGFLIRTTYDFESAPHSSSDESTSVIEEDSMRLFRQGERMVGQGLRAGSRIEWQSVEEQAPQVHGQGRAGASNSVRRMVLIREDEFEQVKSDEEDELTLKC